MAEKMIAPRGAEIGTESFGQPAYTLDDLADLDEPRAALASWVWAKPGASAR